MYVHIGSNRMIRSSAIVGIFDLDGEITTADTKRFLRRVDGEGRAECDDILPLCGNSIYRFAIRYAASPLDMFALRRTIR